MLHDLHRYEGTIACIRCVHHLKGISKSRALCMCIKKCMEAHGMPKHLTGCMDACTNALAHMSLCTNPCMASPLRTRK